MNSSIIADSSGLFSLIVKTDKNNSKAIKITKQMLKQQASIIIPGEIFAEVINALGKKINHNTAIRAGKEIIESDEFVIVDTTEQIRVNAFEKFKNQPESVSFTDCLVMAFADQFQTKDIFGFDEVFRKNGYIRLGVDKT